MSTQQFDIERALSNENYGMAFWDLMKRGNSQNAFLDGGRDTLTGGQFLPASGERAFEKSLIKQSVLRGNVTVMKAYGSGCKIHAHDCDDPAAWVPAGGKLPFFDATDDFTKLEINEHKLVSFVKIDEDFAQDAQFGLAAYLTDRLAGSFARTQDNAIIAGTGEDMPTGILCPDKGADIGVTTRALTFDDVVKLYFSLDRKYRGDAVWLMNDETAYKLRRLKDGDGMYLWNNADSTILGKPVVTANDMPDIGAGACPVAFGNLSYYWLVLRTPVSVKVLKEWLAVDDQLGYIATQLMDGKLVRKDAVKLLQIAA